MEDKKMYDSLLNAGYTSIGVNDGIESIAKKFPNGLVYVFTFKEYRCLGNVLLSQEQLESLYKLPTSKENCKL
ncbi:hypothetical protein SIM22_06165 [Bacillus cereus group sp. BfR-BA-01363]|uniref:hypothetical protein n=1 Tax=unclassified Bacillus cereus group TaxID=2750818 RepID=UPI0029C3B7E9|nr:MULTISPECIES: hypothetical protein [unclassified Bacillus cereus group]MDX5808699.1 hypothetical protein [Bacillus cereus group sp. BfR-BA-02730]MDX5853689.1 hypothetical protein [Bacillus cereus group sp. BfR-BA-01363]